MLGFVNEFWVAEIPLNEIIVGTDFLIKLGAVLDLSAQCCKLMGKWLPLDLNTGTNKTMTVSVIQDLIVPPRTEMLIPGTVEWVGVEDNARTL